MPKVLSEVLFHILILTKDHFFCSNSKPCNERGFFKINGAVQALVTV